MTSRSTANLEGKQDRPRGPKIEIGSTRAAGSWGELRLRSKVLEVLIGQVAKYRNINFILAKALRSRTSATCSTMGQIDSRNRYTGVVASFLSDAADIKV
jgi:hypothetical protein